MSKEVNHIANLLRHGKPVSRSQFKTLQTECTKVVRHLFRKYMNDIVYHPHIKEDIVEDITTMSLVKALNQYNPKKKTQFMTYYYSKARSMTEVEQGKNYRRYHLLNTVRLRDTDLR